jgi:hypothetical protein
MSTPERNTGSRFDSLPSDSSDGQPDEDKRDWMKRKLDSYYNGDDRTATMMAMMDANASAEHTARAWRNALGNYTPPSPTSKTLSDAEKSASGNPPKQAHDIGRQEAQPSLGYQPPTSKLPKPAMTAVAGSDPRLRAAMQLTRWLSRHRRGAAASGGLTIAAVLFFLLTAAGGGMLGSVSQMMERWATGFQLPGYSRRASRVLRDTLFPKEAADAPCTSGKAHCYFQRKSTNQWAQRLREAGFAVNTNSDGSRITAMSFTDSEGRAVAVNRQNFSQLSRTDPHFKALIGNFADTRSFLFRGRATLAQWNLRCIVRVVPKSTDGTRAGWMAALRERFFGDMDADVDKHQTDRSDDVPDGEEAFDSHAYTDEVDGLEEDYKSEAADLRRRALEGRIDYETDLPKTSADLLPPVEKGTAVAAVAKNTAKYSAKGALQGWLSGIDTYCQASQIVRTVSYASKVYRALPLMQFALTFWTAGDKALAGDATLEKKQNEAELNEVAEFSGLLTKQSVATGSKGKSMAQSPGWHLLTEGKGFDWTSLERFTTGGILAKVLDVLIHLPGVSQMSAESCARVNSTAGQAGLLVGGIALTVANCFFPPVAGCVVSAGKGLATGLAAGLIIGITVAVVMPLMIQYVAGVVAPDPFTDPEAGYGTGNALYAGASIAGQEIGKTNGMIPVNETTARQLAALQRQDAATIAAVDAASDRTDGPFAAANPGSWLNRMAIELQPVASGALLDRLASLVGIFGSATGSLAANLTGTAEALTDDPVAFYRGEACQDTDYVALSLLRTSTCGLVYGIDPALLTASEDPTTQEDQYDLLPTIDWLVANGYLGADEDPYAPLTEVEKEMTGQGFSLSSVLPADIDNPLGLSKRADLRDYLRTCVYGTDPITADGYGIELAGGAGKTDQCHRLGDPVLTYFRAYVMNLSAWDAATAAADGTLGIDQNESATTTTADDGVAASGDAAQAAAQILALRDAGKITIADFSSSPAADSATRSLASQQLTDIAAGKPVGITTRCGFTISPITPDPAILNFLVDLGGQVHYSLNSLFGQCHSSKSKHYDGQAVDFGCPLDIATANAVGTKYGVSHNYENCSVNGHWHYSVGGK